jgi:hypothetical protein
MKDKRLAENATFYNYTLIKKVTYTQALKTISAGLIVFFLICDVIYFKIEGLITFIVAIPTVALMHIILITIVLSATNDPSRKIWRLQYHPPCMGYLPDGFVSLKSLYRVHAHILLVGAAAIAVSYNWIPSSYFNSLMFVHLGFLLPRYLIFWKFKKLKPSGYLKFNPKDASYFIS